MSSFKFSKIQVALFLVLITLSVQRCVGKTIVCEDLPKNVCAFAISWLGKRCSIENYASKDGKTKYQSCKTSNVVVEGITNWIESKECIWVCGVDRNSTQLSYDSLLEPQFASKLCSPSCYQNCPNIVDLYFGLALEKGVFLPDLCEVQQTNPHRVMEQVVATPGTRESRDLEGLSPANAPTDAPVEAPPDDASANTPVNAPANAPTNAPTNPPANAPADAPANSPANAPVNSPVNAPANAPANSPANAPINAPANTPANAPANTPDEASPVDGPSNAPASTPTPTPTPAPTPSPDAS